MTMRKLALMCALFTTATLAEDRTYSFECDTQAATTRNSR